MKKFILSFGSLVLLGGGAGLITYDVEIPLNNTTADTVSCNERLSACVVVFDSSSDCMTVRGELMTKKNESSLAGKEALVLKMMDRYGCGVIDINPPEIEGIAEYVASARLKKSYPTETLYKARRDEISSAVHSGAPISFDEFDEYSTMVDFEKARMDDAGCDISDLFDHEAIIDSAEICGASYTLRLIKD